MKKQLIFTIKDQNEENDKDDNRKVFWMNNIIILDNEIKTHNKYIITDSEESDLLWKDKLTITAAGLDRGLRHVRDGYTFFGENESYDNCIINDYLVNMPPEYKGKCNKRLFVIFFERQSEKFFFRALKESEMFVYVKINKNYAISKKKYFQIGNIIFHVEPYINSGIKISIHNNEIKHNSKSKYEEHFYDRTVLILL